MPPWICKHCNYQCRDKHAMERHLNRKYPCNSTNVVTREITNVVTRENLLVIKQDDVQEEDITQPEKLKVNVFMDLLFMVYACYFP